MAWHLGWLASQAGGSSTSALIFSWIPILAIVVGLVGYIIGALIGMFFCRRTDQENQDIKK